MNIDKLYIIICTTILFISCGSDSKKSAKDKKNIPDTNPPAQTDLVDTETYHLKATGARYCVEGTGADIKVYMSETDTPEEGPWNYVCPTGGSYRDGSKWKRHPGHCQFQLKKAKLKVFYYDRSYDVAKNRSTPNSLEESKVRCNSVEGALWID